MRSNFGFGRRWPAATQHLSRRFGHAPARAVILCPCLREIGRPWPGDALDWTTWVAPLGRRGGALYRSLLVVDASQGIEAQTLANVHLAIAQNLVIIPVLNKIDLASADPAGEGAVKVDKALRMQDRGEDELDYLLPRRKMSWFRAKA